MDHMKIPTGIPGFDDILKGGLEKGWSYLIKGEPGSGKTIFGLQFLLRGGGEDYTFPSMNPTMK